MTGHGSTGTLGLRLRALVKRPPVTCAPTDPIERAARTMAQHGVGSIIVVGPGGEPAGIVTDRDLRTRALATGRAPADPVQAIMSSPVTSVSPEAFVFEALLEMTRRNIHHLALVEGGRLVGIVSSHDLLLAQATAPLELARAIQESASMDELISLMPRLTEATGHLFQQGLSGYQMGRVVAELNDLVIRRVLNFVQADLGKAGLGEPPVPFCWFVLGSEGRREQTLRTDQDNALVYADPAATVRPAAERYFRELAGRMIEALVAAGYPRCPGGTMASNPRWCQPLAVWRSYLAGWIQEPLAQNVLQASIYFDLRPVAGEEALSRALRDEIRTQVGAWRSFPRYLAKLAVSHAPPLGWFSRFRMERVDGRRGINVKLNALLILVNAVRTFAIELGLDETNTIERLEAATRAGGYLSAGEADDVRQAYETIFHLRLRHQLARIAAGQPPDNLVDPHALGESDQRRLKESFRAIRRLQGKIALRYFTEAL